MKTLYKRHGIHPAAVAIGLVELSAVVYCSLNYWV